MIKFNDRADISKTRITEDGFLVTRAKALRAGIQSYHTSELGLDGDKVVKVFRPESSVFDAASLQSLSHAPVTMGHPGEAVTADNWNELAVGEVSTDVMRDGEFAALPLILKDQKAIKAVQDGTAELSAGYIAPLMCAEDGADYDYVMGSPKYNHLAIVDKARAGSEARIGDSEKPWGAAPLTTQIEDKELDLIKVMVGDKAVQVAADDADNVIKLIADHSAELLKKDEEIAKLKVECADANKLVKTDEEIAELVADGVKELGEVVEKAKLLVKDYDATGKGADDIRKEVIEKVYGEDAVKDFKTDAEIKAAFSVAKSVKAEDSVRKGIAEKAGKMTDGAWDGLFKAKKGK